MNSEPQDIRIEAATPDEVAKYASSDKGAPSTSPAQPEQGAEGGAETELQKAQRERDEFKDKWLRAKADAQNQARRLRSDRDEAVRLAVAHFARGMLTVVDDLERTLEAAQEDHSEDRLLEGVRIVRDHLLKTLSEHQIQRIESLGQPFDPALHQAITQQSSTDLPSGTIVQEVHPGYKMNDRVLRPAMVIVSCEPPGSKPQADAPKPGEILDTEE
jgi:molecular chaperone GrpE